MRAPRALGLSLGWVATRGVQAAFLEIKSNLNPNKGVKFFSSQASNQIKGSNIFQIKPQIKPGSSNFHQIKSQIKPPACHFSQIKSQIKSQPQKFCQIKSQITQNKAQIEPQIKFQVTKTCQKSGKYQFESPLSFLIQSYFYSVLGERGVVIRSVQAVQLEEKFFEIEFFRCKNTWKVTPKVNSKSIFYCVIKINIGWWKKW